MSGPSSADLKQRVRELATKGNDSTFELAEALAELWALPKPPEGDHPTLKELIDLTKISRRTTSRRGTKSPMQLTSPVRPN